MIKTYETVRIMFQDTEEELLQKFKRNETSFEYFKEICEWIDRMAEEHEVDSMDVDIDSDSGVLTISLYSMDITFWNGNSDIFYQIITTTSRFGFERHDKNTVKVILEFDNLWEEKD